MTDPYKLPDGPVAIQFSGGRTSGYMLKHILDRYDGKLPDDCHVLFQNTGREMPETLDFVQRCSNEWGVHIVWLEYDAKLHYKTVSHNSASRNGEPFEELIERYGYLPNGLSRWCTGKMKIVPSNKYLHKELGYNSWHAVLGIRKDEEQRAKNVGVKKDRSLAHYPLVLAGVSAKNVVSWWEKQDFDLSLPNANGKTPLGNCDGCFLKSEKNRAFLARERPDLAEWWAKIEEKYDDQFDRNGYSWRQLIDHASAQADWVFDEKNDTYCEAELGGCHD
jgi:3'-phosphoadenosine 5'-phosphosulfate sulfotransferase (PAPS reductase)/FAD synthetase